MFPPPALVNLPANTSSPIIHVKIPIASCSQPANLSFPASGIGSNLTLTYFEAGQPMLQNYNLVHTDTYNSVLCPNGQPSITSISTNTPTNTPIGGGIGTILTINGSNLGNDEGSVLFPDANDNDPIFNPIGQTIYVEANADNDITAMTWTSNQVTIPIPNLNKEQRILGGGKIKLELENGGVI